ncbi:MAG: 3-phosphoshikimate 1-carboxyvinyltransferase [Bryobacteraceae bacterium]|nr:3-phosphoshikimate 1-carboxyvinyltransferase [Bryobacteraceae bacterium]MDW8379472.1 3-phosphoshikimate 1-carboxyvinyltransferase [Bryobacterales bacterium]
MVEIIHPARALQGEIRLPGDKSISHRYAMLASVAEGKTRILNYSTGADCASTLGAMRALGVEIERNGAEVVIHGVGLEGLKPAAGPLDAGNSGSTIRMLSGILAGQSFSTTISGDESLSRRPMGRIITPLEQMGARIEAREGKFPPLTIHGAKLRPIDYTLPVASAQVKSCILFAGLFCEGVTTVREPVPTRDHSEIALRAFGAEVESIGGVITLEGRPALKGCELYVPGDLSSAAFFLVAAGLLPGSRIGIQAVGLNPTRSALLDFLIAGGSSIKVVNLSQHAGEVIGDLVVEYRPWRGGVLEKSLTAALIDEIPVLSVLGAASRDGLIVRDAAELRVKETDRIATLAENLKRMGIQIEVREDGFEVPGKQKFHAAKLDSFGDHRIAMAFSVAALAADGPCEIENAEAASVSFPEFYQMLRSLSA